MKPPEPLPPFVSDLIQPLALATVTDVAPDEVPLLESAYSEILETLSERSVRPPAELLSFGGGEVALLAPVAVLFAKATLSFLWEQAKGATGAEVSRFIKEQLHAFLRGKEKKKAAPLSQEQLQQLERVLLKEAKRQSLAPDLARRLADATIRSLIV